MPAGIYISCISI